jgi:tetratricopeptide (TPR) repeat protein
MIHPRFLIAATLAALAIPASGGITVIGSSSARLCYEAADSKRIPNAESLRLCDRALNEEILTGEDRVATHVNRGILRLRLNDISGSLIDFDQAIALDPDEPEAYLNKAAALMRQDHVQAALPLFNHALEKNTRRPEIAYFGRGVAYETLGRIPEAYADFRQAAALAPQWEEARVELSRFRVVRD